MTALTLPVLVLALALLPGGCAAWAFERHTHRYGNRLKDWILRLAGVSALLLAAGAWPLHWVFHTYSERFRAGETLPWPLYLAPLGYLAIPAGLGWVFGYVVKRFRRLLSPRRAPTAWDYLFEARAAGHVRCKMHSGRWIGGFYGQDQNTSSYASSDDRARDLYIAFRYEMDQHTGHALREGDRYAWTGGGVLLKWDDIETLEFHPARGHPGQPQEESDHAEDDEANAEDNGSA